MTDQLGSLGAGADAADSSLLRRWRPLAAITATAEPLGRACFGLGMAGLGVLALIYADFALQWQPVPQGVPARELLAYANGVILLAAGVALWLRPVTTLGAAVLAAMLALWVLALHAPRVAAGEPAAWLGAFEALALTCGALVMLGTRTRARQGFRLPDVVLGRNAALVGRYGFAVSLFAFGASHFVYLEGAAAMVPGWLPAPEFWARFTGAGHIAAGLGLLTGVLPRLAAVLLATMFSSFVLLLHLPRVVAALDNRAEWTMIFVSLALTGAAWTVAAALRRRGA